jgi:hypothetical protein
MKKAGVAFPGFLFPLAGSNFVNDDVNSIICIEKSQPFENLTMLERGLYATFLSEATSINAYATLYKQYGVPAVTNAINALLVDGHFRAEKGSRPVRYERSPRKKKSAALSDELLNDCLRVYQEVRDPHWVNHNTVTRALKKALTAFVQQVGQDNALDILKRGLNAQKNGWANGKKVDFINLLTNDKVIRFGEPTNDTTSTMQGMVYRLNTSKPDPRLPTSSSYAIRVDARNNGTLHGFVFPEGQPNHGILTTIPAKAITTQLQDWGTYQKQHA